jgi:hypothetical protein
MRKMALNHMLYEATMEVLEALGEDVLQSLVWQMELEGVSFAPETFNIKTFSKALHGLFGDGADSLLEEIYQNAVCRLELLRPTILENNDGIAGASNGAVPNPLYKLLTLFGDAPAYDGNPREESKE